MKLTLEALTGNSAPRQLDTARDGQVWLLLGRGAECQWRFGEPMVSTRHATLHAEKDGFYLTDQQSTNCTLVNGVRVQRVLLRDGDVIQLGYSGPQLVARIAPARAAEPVVANAVPPPPATPALPVGHAPVNTIGLFDPERDTGRTPNSLGWGCAALCGGGLAFMVLALTVSSLGVFAALLGALTAFIPALAYLLLFLWLDRYDPEPFPPLAFAFAWGAVFAIFVSGIFNSIFGSATASMLGATTGDALTGIVSAPFIEEATKGLGVLLIWAIFRKDFDSVVDGIVYAGVVALGFAAVENVDYYGRSFNEGGFGGLFGTFMLRGLLAPFSHVLFTSMTGIGCGIARETHNPRLRVAAPLLGYFGAMILHALWNTLASFSNQVFFLGYLLFQVPLFLAFLGAFLYLVRREGRILREALALEVRRGLLTQQQLDTVVSVFRRTNWVWSALGDKAKLDARRQFLRTAAKLGLCYWHVERAAAAQSQTASFPLIPRLQAELFALRERI